MRLYNDVDLHAFVDSQVSAERAAAVRSYLAATPDDAARVECWKRQNKALQDLFAPTAHEAVPLWLTVGQIAGAQPAQPLPPRVTPLRRARRAEPAGPVPSTPSASWRAAALIVTFAAGLLVAGMADRLPGWLGLIAPAHHRGLGFEERAWEAHEVFGLDPDRPVDVSEVTPGGVQSWLDRRVPFATRVPDLSGMGWTLLGGRLAPSDVGPGALLVYRNEAGDRLSIFSSLAAHAPSPAASSAARTHGLVTWTNDEVSYALLSTRGKAWLDANEAALKQAVLASE